MLNLDEIEVFLSIIEHGSFRKAAQALHKTQPVVTYHIQQLEHYLGFSLFDRSHYKATLSKQGKAFYSKALSIYTQAMSIESLRVQKKEGTETQVSISVSSLYPLSKLKTILKAVQDTYPNTWLYVSIDTLAGFQKVSKNQVDLAISELEETSIQLIQEKTELINLKRCISSVHPLAQQLRVSQSDLINYPQIILKSTAETPVEDKAIVKHAKQWVVSEMSIKLELIESGFGWGNLPEHLIQPKLNRSLKVLESHNQIELDVQLYKLKPAKIKQGPVLQLLWQLL